MNGDDNTYLEDFDLDEEDSLMSRIVDQRAGPVDSGYGAYGAIRRPPIYGTKPYHAMFPHSPSYAGKWCVIHHFCGIGLRIHGIIAFGTSSGARIYKIRIGMEEQMIPSENGFPAFLFKSTKSREEIQKEIESGTHEAPELYRRFAFSTVQTGQAIYIEASGVIEDIMVWGVEIAQ